MVFRFRRTLDLGSHDTLSHSSAHRPGTPSRDPLSRSFVVVSMNGVPLLAVQLVQTGSSADLNAEHPRRDLEQLSPSSQLAIDHASSSIRAERTAIAQSNPFVWTWLATDTARSYPSHSVGWACVLLQLHSS